MRIEGKIQKSGKYWAVEVPMLFIFTKGKSKEDGFTMAKDAIEELIGIKGFEVNIIPYRDNTFSIGSNDDSKLMAFALKQQRAKAGLTIRQVAERLGSSSPTSYSQYESGRVKPSLDKYTQLLKAINETIELILKIG